MLKWMPAVFFVNAVLFASPVLANSRHDELMFEKIFSSWTHAFNHKDLNNTCQLFSKHITANYQGTPTKNYESLCGGFKKIFNEARDYEYTFKLHHVYRSNQLAAVRVTWHLRISEQGKFISETQDEGLDVFQQDKKGNWKIVNYLGYPQSKN